MTIRSRWDDRGAVAVIVAVFVVVAMILVAFVVDRGRAYAERTQLQNSVDAAALAGGQEFGCGFQNDAAARAKAIEYAGHNGVDPANVLVNITEGTRHYLNVQASRNLSLFFGQFANANSAGVAAQATVLLSCNEGYAVFAGNLGFGDSGGMTLTGSIYSDGTAKITSNANSIVDGSIDWNDGCQGCDKAKLPDGTTTPNQQVAEKSTRCYAWEIALDRPASGLPANCTDPGDGETGVIQSLAVTDLSGSPGSCTLVDNSFASSHGGLVDCGSQNVSITATNMDGTNVKAIKTSGQITIDGSLTIGTPPSLADRDGNPVVLYSENADRGIEIKGSNHLVMNGYLYTPQGQVYVGGSARLSWVGVVVAEDVTINGTGSGGGVVGFNALFATPRLIQ